MTTTTPTTPLTDAEIAWLDAEEGRPARAAAEIRALRAQVAQHAQGMARVTDENQGLRAERDDLLATLKGVAVTLQVWADVFAEKELPSISGMMDKRLTQVRATIARAEGRAK